MKRNWHATPSAAEYLGVAPQTLCKWRCVGGGPKFVKMGGMVRYEQSDLDAFIEERKRRNTSGAAA